MDCRVRQDGFAKFYCSKAVIVGLICELYSKKGFYHLCLTALHNDIFDAIIKSKTAVWKREDACHDAL